MSSGEVGAAATPTHDRGTPARKRPRTPKPRTANAEDSKKLRTQAPADAGTRAALAHAGDAESNGSNGSNGGDRGGRRGRGERLVLASHTATSRDLRGTTPGGHMRPEAVPIRSRPPARASRPGRPFSAFSASSAVNCCSSALARHARSAGHLRRPRFAAVPSSSQHFSACAQSRRARAVPTGGSSAFLVSRPPRSPSSTRTVPRAPAPASAKVSTIDRRYELIGGAVHCRNP